jgi:hypothetical protein
MLWTTVKQSINVAKKAGSSNCYATFGKQTANDKFPLNLGGVGFGYF